MIPKKIHYIWLGGKSKSPLDNMCILSWHEKLSDYEIIEWNESNLDIELFRKKNKFFDECYKRKLWAFVSDYLRFYILYNEGGIYLDTDVQTLKSFDDFLDYQLFLGREKKENNIGAGVIGCTKHNKNIKKILEYYDNEILDSKIYTSPNVVEETLKDKIDCDEIKIFDYPYFYPYAIDENFSMDCIEKNTYSIHWYKPSWFQNKHVKLYLQTKHIKNPLKKNIVKVIKLIRFYQTKLFHYIKTKFKLNNSNKTPVDKNTVGIITLYGNSNYGNKLQNYALMTKLKNFNLNVHTYKITDQYSNKSVALYNCVIFYIKLYIKRCLKKYKPVFYRHKSFIKFNNKYLNYSNDIIYNSNTKIKQEPNIVFFGSDQIWNPNFGNDIQIYLGKNFKESVKVSYAASFGVSELPKKSLKMYKETLNNFKHISVREDAGKKIVEDITNEKEAEVLIDPTMLLTKDEWQIVSKKPKNLGEEKYILNYFLGNLSSEKRKSIEALADKNGWKVINILDKNDPFYTSGPSEFVYLEEHAELICTDSFHSCVFGILMDTPFVVFDRDDKTASMNSRIETLLSKFKLEDRKYNGILDEKYLKCDYSTCYKILEKERKKADEFLRKALNR